MSARQHLLVTVERLPKPDVAAFQKIAPPGQTELEGYRVVQDARLRHDVVASGLGELVQRPGPGNWKKNQPPPYILKIYPNFDAPTASVRVAGSRGVRRVQRQEGLFSEAVVHELRTKWEGYYLDTRPERQREHARLADSADPAMIAARAKELITTAKRESRPLSSREAMLQAIDELTSDFETLMRRRHGDLLVDVFGIPQT